MYTVVWYEDTVTVRPNIIIEDKYILENDKTWTYNNKFKSPLYQHGFQILELLIILLEQILHEIQELFSRSTHGNIIFGEGEGGGNYQ